MKGQDPIPEYLVKLRNLRQLIRDVETFDFDIRERVSFGSLPPDVLLSCIVDLVLMVKNHFNSGVFGSRNNPGMIFKESVDYFPRTEFSVSFDPVPLNLHTLKSIKIQKPSNYFWDPRSSHIFSKLAETLINIKRGTPIRKAFMAFVEESDLKTSTKKSSSKDKNKARIFWWRRQQRRYHRRD